jgi:alpha-galactosidase
MRSSVQKSVLTSTVTENSASPHAPRISATEVFGARVGNPFHFRIAACGERPIKFAADGLPSGLTLDPSTGNITGSVAKSTTAEVTLRASNRHGTCTQPLRIVIGGRIGLTPPMGWNSWNCWGGRVDGEKVLEAAHALVDSGLRDHGWCYVNIDDGWQGVRGGKWRAIQPNRKFPDMKGLADTIHSMGLKFGLYSTPWRGTYEGHIGSSCDRADGVYDWIAEGDCNEVFRIGKGGSADWDEKRRLHYAFGRHSFVKQDIAQMVEWGIDYLKYDWRPNDVAHAREVQRLLKTCGRDVFFSLSNKAPFLDAVNWGSYANAWRTTGDIEDTWESVKDIGFNQDPWSHLAGPGHWNDPDMLVMGRVGWGASSRPTRLTHDEQRSHFSLWCLLAAPLLLGCDLSKLDSFTLGLLTNDEVLAVNQDPLGRQGVRVAGDNSRQVIVKPMEDRSIAVGMFNVGEVESKVTLAWSDLLISGPRKVRDLLANADDGVHSDFFSATVPPHGVKLIRLFEGGNGNGRMPAIT